MVCLRARRSGLDFRQGLADYSCSPSTESHGVMVDGHRPWGRGSVFGVLKRGCKAQVLEAFGVHGFLTYFPYPTRSHQQNIQPRLSQILHRCHLPCTTKFQHPDNRQSISLLNTHSLHDTTHLMPMPPTAQHRYSPQPESQLTDINCTHSRPRQRARPCLLGTPIRSTTPASHKRQVRLPAEKRKHENHQKKKREGTMYLSSRKLST